MLALDKLDSINDYPKGKWADLLALISVLQKMNAQHHPSEFNAYHQVALRFDSIVHAMPIVVIFDWSSWLTQMKHKHGDDMNEWNFNALDLTELRQLITAIVRANRFCENLIESEMSAGRITKILQAIAFKVVGGDYMASCQKY